MSRWAGRLEIGGVRPLMVRREMVPHLALGKCVLFASDLHLRGGGSDAAADALLRIAEQERPDITLLGGDLVDWRTGLDPLQRLVEAMRSLAPVAAVGGNHDRWSGLEQVRDAVRGGGGHWLEDAPLQWAADAAVYGAPEQALLPARCHILCAHVPQRPGAHRGFQLVLSGHLHGGQIVLFERGGRLYPGALAYRWNGLRFHADGVTLLVSRGVRDTVPLRWNCPREVILVHL
jgi:predicted MPP superfamily phosphohydrolase